jgi:exopolysaccharide biosynthesis polyprenyl glycosylphosphotransferase
MNKRYGSEDILRFSALEDLERKGARTEKKWPRGQFWLYQWALGVQDFAMACCGLWLCHLLFGLPFAMVDTASYMVVPLLAVLFLSFFSTYRLYSYHLIFSTAKHRAGLVRAIAWSSLVITLMTGQYAYAHFGAGYPLASWIFLGVGLGGVAWIILFRRQLLHCLFRALGISLIAVWLVSWIYQGQESVLVYEQMWAGPVGLLFAAILVGTGRRFVLTTVYSRWLRRYYRRQVAIIGSNEAAAEIASMIIENNAPFWVAGTIGGNRDIETSVPKDRLGDIIELPYIAKKNRLDEILVTEEKMDRRTLISLLDFGLSNGITIWFTPALLPIIDRKIYIDSFCGIPMIKMCSLKRVVLFNRMKYALDAFVALPLSVALLPLFAVIALAIKINSRGPVFYGARAIGKNGAEFKMFKFRSMRVDSDAGIHKEFVTKLIKGEIGGESDGSGSKPLKITNDPRITWVGGLLRKYSLDELPQLINVLLGQMSLIGPRPCLPYEFDVYQDWYKKRAAIRPGITGLWQVAGRSEVAFEEMILLDLYYLYNRSLWMDIMLVIETVFVVLTKKGAY